MQRWSGLVLLALACSPIPERVDPPDAGRVEPASAPRPTIEHTGFPTPLRPEPRPPAGDEFVWVEQLDISSPESWHFEPGGDRVAVTEGRECGVWSIASGEHLGFAPPGESTPCTSWPAIEPFGLAPFQARRTIGESGRELVLAGRRATLPGQQPVRVTARSGLTFQGGDFSPDGKQVALLAGAPRGPVEVEIWNLDAGSRSHVLAVTDALEHSEIESLALRWTAEAVVVAAKLDLLPEPPEVDEDGDGYDDDAYGVMWPEPWLLTRAWPLPDADPIELDFQEEGHGWATGLLIDPDERWLIESRYEIVSREEAVEDYAAIPIGAAGPFGLDWQAEPLSHELEPSIDVEPRTRRWVDHVGSSFIETQGLSYVHHALPPVDAVGWDMLSLVAGPLPERAIRPMWSDGLVLAGDEMRHHGWTLVLAGEGELLADVDVCGGYEQECRQARIAPRGCRVVDADWHFTELLLACGDRWMLAPVPEDPNGDAIDWQPRSLDPSTLRVLAIGAERARGQLWGPSGLVLADDEGVRAFEGHSPSLVVPDAQLVRAKLDEELDLALLVTHEGPRVLDLVDEALDVVLAWQAPIEHAAFSPDRRLVALAGAGTLAVFERGRASPLVRWQAVDPAGIAFRQDGAVLFVGIERPLPELALDPRSGEPVAAAQLDRTVFARIAAAELDPSWRWAVEEDGTFLRTLDGEALQGRRTESGWYEDGYYYQSIAEGYRIRIGNDPLSPIHRVEEFAAQLHRPNLVDEFFAGVPLPRPRYGAAR